jgi:hypothetical protein
MRLVVFSCFETARENTIKKKSSKQKKKITMNTTASPPPSPLSPPSPQSPAPSESTTNSSRPRLTAAVMDVMDSRVSKGTKASYCRSNAQFISWIYFGDDDDLKQQIIAPWFLDKLKEVERATRLQSANMSNSEKREKRISRAVTQTARKAVEVVNCQDDNCPVLFANLTFQIFSSYLVSKHQARIGGGEEGGEGEGGRGV